MKFIGIDFSLTSTGITIIDGNSIKHASFINRYCWSKAADFDIDKIDQRKLKGLEGLDTCVIYDRRANSVNKKAKDKFLELHRWHDEHIKGCEEMKKAIFDNYLSDILEKDDIVCIEHYITKGGGNQTIQIIEATMRIKQAISEVTSNIYPVPAPTLKMFAGKGNFTKEQMFDAYVREDIDHKYRDNCEKNKGLLVKNPKTLVKPVDDVIDSYFAAKYAKSILSA